METFLSGIIFVLLVSLFRCSPEIYLQNLCKCGEGTQVKGKGRQRGLRICANRRHTKTHSTHLFFTFKTKAICCTSYRFFLFLYSRNPPKKTSFRFFRFVSVGFRFVCTLCGIFLLYQLFFLLTLINYFRLDSASIEH